MLITIEVRHIKDLTKAVEWYSAPRDIIIKDVVMDMVEIASETYPQIANQPYFYVAGKEWEALPEMLHMVKYDKTQYRPGVCVVTAKKNYSECLPVRVVFNQFSDIPPIEVRFADMD